DLDEGAYSLVPETRHPSITQALGIVSRSPHQAEAQQFIDFILSKEGQAILGKYGYTSP
ncbi:MAG TPA: extracellular solute-binding protein, partial [Anaerolineae bacterium]|nr:extracellular solute-binding protein [Anaerolineae bacterium]